MKVEDLSKAIAYVMSGVDQNQLGSEGADLITFDDGWVRSYDGTTSVSYPLDANLSCSVPAKPLYDLLTKLGGGNVRLSSEDGAFHLRGEGKHLSLQETGRELDRDVFDLSSLGFEPLPGDFVEALGLCAFSAARDPSMGVLNGVYVGGSTVMASDNYRIGRYEMDGKIDGEVVIPYECVGSVVKMEGIERVALSPEGNPAWIHFESADGVVLSVGLKGGDYEVGDLTELLNVERAGNYSFPEGLAEAVGRASVLADDALGYQPFVTLRRSGDQLVLAGERREVGRYEETMPWDSDVPEDVVMELNPNFLVKILRKTRDFSVSVDGKFAVFSAGRFEILEMAKQG